MAPSGFSMKKRLIRWIIIDFVMLGVFLCVFCYFHHVRPLRMMSAADSYTMPPPQPTPQPTPMPEATPTPTPSQKSDPADDSPSPSPEAAETPMPASTGLLGGKFADKFTSGEVERAAMSYRSANVCLETTKVQTADPCLTYFLVDIYIQDISSFQTIVALDYKDENPSDIKTAMEARRLSRIAGGIVSLSGDHFATQPTGRWIMRNRREWHRRLPFEMDICVLYSDGVMETYTANVAQRNVDAILARDPLHIWSFGPELLINGAATKRFSATNGSGTKRNPRSAIGYYEPGHYCFLLVDGRQRGYSLGMTYTEMSQFFYELGCTAAYNLDGGDSAVLCWGDKWLNHPQDEEPRGAADLLYIVEPTGGKEAS